MAEMIGVAAAVAAIPSVFARCMEIFDAFTSEDALGTEYQVLALKLAILQLRLLRWRDCVTLDEEGPDHAQDASFTEKGAISELLSNILDELKHAEAISSHYTASEVNGRS